MPVIDGRQKKITFTNAYTKYDHSLSRTNTPTLSASRSLLAAAKGVNYALFGGGAYGSKTNSGTTGPRSVVDAYDASLTISNPSSLSVARCNLGAARAGAYVIFAGGDNVYYTSSGEESYSTVDAYDSSNLTKIAVSSLATKSTFGVYSATSVGDYALFGSSSRMTVYGPTLSKVLSSVDFAKFTTSASNSNYAVLSSGKNVIAFDTSLTVRELASLANQVSIAASSNDFAVLFPNSNIYSGMAYNTSLTATSLEPCSVRYSSASSSVAGYILIAGGSSSTTSGSAALSSITTYDASLTKSSEASLEKGRAFLAAASIGDYAIFGGGVTHYASTNTRYTVNKTDFYKGNPFTTLEVTIPPFSKYKFTEETEQSTRNSSLSKKYTRDGHIGLSGYIKPNANRYFTGQYT